MKYILILLFASGPHTLLIVHNETKTLKDCEERGEYYLNNKTSEYSGYICLPKSATKK